jgi:hypothetical protein
MSNPFNEVPYDVLQHILAPLLDLESTVNFNRIVENRDRVSRRFQKDYATMHQMNVSSAKMKSLIYNEQVGQKRVLRFYRMFKASQDPVISNALIQHNLTYRNVLSKKFMDLQDPTSLIYGINLSPGWMASFIKLGQKGITYLNKYPYLYEV